MTLLLCSVSAMAQAAPTAPRPIVSPRTAAEPPPVYPRGPVVTLHTSDRPGAPSRLGAEPYKLTLWGKRARYNDWFPICDAPCDVAIYLSDSYQIRGPRLPSSAEFMLPRSGAVTLQASPGRYKTYIGGTLLAVFSSPFIIQSLTTLLIGSKEVRIAGASLLGVGMGMLIGGMITVARSRITVSSHAGSQLSRRPKSTQLAWTASGLVF